MADTEDTLIKDALYLINGSINEYDNNITGERMQSIFRQARDEVLESVQPNFAKRIIEDFGTVGEWKFEPADLIAWLSPMPVKFRTTFVAGEYRKEVKLASKDAHYILRSSDVMSWPSLFKEAVSAKFKLKLCTRKDGNVLSILTQEYIKAASDLRNSQNSESTLGMRCWGWYYNDFCH